MAKVFFSYSHADEVLRDQLEKQLSLLKRQGVIEAWHDRRIGAGEVLGDAIDRNLEDADIILLLVSADFLDSEYCYNKEMLRAMARHEGGEATVIPVILRACDWHGTPFGKLLATPTDGRPVTQWPDRDQALFEVAKAIRQAAERRAGSKAHPAPQVPSVAAFPSEPRGPRSSNLRIAKSFSQMDKDGFVHEAFDFIEKFFANSIEELSRRNEGIDGRVKKVDANRFTAVLYQNGEAAARCTVFMGGSIGNGIGYANGEVAGGNSYNDNLVVESDDQSMYFRPMFAHDGRNAKLSFEGAAEHLWAHFFGPLQRFGRGNLIL